MKPTSMGRSDRTNQIEGEHISDTWAIIPKIHEYLRYPEESETKTKKHGELNATSMEIEMSQTCQTCHCRNCNFGPAKPNRTRGWSMISGNY